ncbi:hypothetical protein OROGR_012856 [Orobanche gracilis]
MASADVEHPGTPCFQPEILQTTVAEENESKKRIKSGESHLRPSHKEQTSENQLTGQEKVTGGETLDKGYLNYGCSHYHRRCRVRSPCCNEIFSCRHCHNDAKNNICIDQKLRHDVPRHLIEKVICSLCGTEQEVQQVCKSCGVCMGRYFCGTCKLFDEDTSKQQYHCDGCGICR